MSAHAIFFFKFLFGQDVNAQVFHRRRLVLFAERHHTHHVDSRLVNSLTDFVCRNVGGRTDQDTTGELQLPFPTLRRLSVKVFVFQRNVVQLLVVALDEMVDERSGGAYDSHSSFTRTGLSCSGRSLDDGETRPQSVGNGCSLRIIQGSQTGNVEVVRFI